MTPREVARRVLDRVDKGGAWATLSLDGELTRSGLDERDRRLVSELVYGVLRHRARLDRALSAHAELKRTPPKVVTALRLAAYQLLFLDRVPGYAAVDDAVSAARAAGGAKLAGFCNAVLRKLSMAREPALPREPRARIEVEYSLPSWIADELEAALRDAPAVPVSAPAVGRTSAGADAAAAAAQPASAAAASDATPSASAQPMSAASDATAAQPAPATSDATAAASARGASASGDAASAPSALDEPASRIATPGVAASPLDRLRELAAAFSQPAPIIARANALRTTREAVIAQLEAAGVTATPIAAAPMAIALDGLGDPGRNASFTAGQWTVQDTGAQLVGLIAAPRPGQRILDACAGVGGKSTHLAELAGDASPIDAADQSATKLELAARTAQRLGITSLRRIVCDLLDPAAPLAAAYDLIVLDAPCSGLGVLRRHPDAKWRLKPDDVPRLAKLQRQLLDAVVARLAPGGTLIYSVCTFTRAEGPAQIASLVARTGLRLVSEHRTWPPDADAFYLARLER